MNEIWHLCLNVIVIYESKDQNNELEVYLLKEKGNKHLQSTKTC
jgi:hypothetical protein